MSDHLPECPMSVLPKATLGYVTTTWPDGVVKRVNWDCICDLLRACEQRVLDAAREAVAALEPLLGRSKHEGGYDCCGCATIDYLWTDALDAIDALKESK